MPGAVGWLTGVRPGPASVSQLTALQRAAGNRATVSLVDAHRAPPVAQRAAALSVQRAGATPQDLATALDDLRTSYPLVRSGTHGGVTSGQADEFWQEHLAGKDLAVLVDTLLRNVLSDDERAGREIFVSLLYAAGELALKVEVAGDTQEAKRTTVLQVFSVGEDGRLQVEIRSVYAPGRGRAVLGKGLLPLFDQVGVTRVWLDASGIGGSTDGVFAWARYGFVPFPRYWEKMRVRGHELLGEYKRAQWRALAAQACDSADPRALRHLVELSWTAGEQAKEFLNRVLQADLTWEGELDLAHPADRAWIERYAAGAKAAEFAELLVDLPPAQQRPARRGYCTIL